MYCSFESVQRTCFRSGNAITLRGAKGGSAKHTLNGLLASSVSGAS